MKAEDFRKLVTSIKQAGRIHRGEAKASRTFELRPTDAKAIRTRLGRSQSET